MFSGKKEKEKERERGAMLRSKFCHNMLIWQLYHLGLVTGANCVTRDVLKLWPILKMGWETVQPKFEAARSVGPC